MKDIIFFDYDMFGRLNERNDITFFYNEEALLNSIRIWFTSRKGDRLRSPNTGGFLDFQIDKLMNDETIENFKQRIARALQNDFNNLFEVVFLDLQKRSDLRLLIVDLQIVSKKLNISSELNMKIKI